jgi:hypothetical protein
VSKYGRVLRLVNSDLISYSKDLRVQSLAELKCKYMNPESVTVVLVMRSQTLRKLCAVLVQLEIIARSVMPVQRPFS